VSPHIYRGVVPFAAMPLLMAVVLAIFPGLEGLGGALSCERPTLHWLGGVVEPSLIGAYPSEGEPPCHNRRSSATASNRRGAFRAKLQSHGETLREMGRMR
jgi:hypothetical protein